MNITSVALSDFNSASASVLPLTASGNRKSGAAVPSGSILEGVSAMFFLRGASGHCGTGATKNKGPLERALAAVFRLDGGHTITVFIKIRQKIRGFGRGDAFHDRAN